MLLCPSFMKSLGSLSDGGISCSCFFTHEFMILPFELQGRIRTVGICGQQELEPGSGSAIQGRKPTVYKLFLNVGAFPYEFVMSCNSKIVVLGAVGECGSSGFFLMFIQTLF